VALVLVAMAAIGLHTAEAAFSATTSNSGSNWTAGTWSTGSGDYETFLPNGPYGNGVLWTGSNVRMTSVAWILSYKQTYNVNYCMTGSMATSPTGRGYGVFVRGSVPGGSYNFSGFSFQVDVGSQNRFTLMWWSNGSERPGAIATTNFPEGFNANASHNVCVTVYGNRLRATVDGKQRMLVDLPTTRVKVNNIWYEVPTGGRYGLRTWYPTVAYGSNLVATASSLISSAAQIMIASVDCAVLDPIAGSNPVEPPAVVSTPSPTAVIEPRADPPPDLVATDPAGDLPAVSSCPPVPCPSLAALVSPPLAAGAALDPAVLAPVVDGSSTCVPTVPEPLPTESPSPSPDPTVTASPSPEPVVSDSASPSPEPVVSDGASPSPEPGAALEPSASPDPSPPVG
jgi:hypothetical protein